MTRITVVIRSFLLLFLAAAPAYAQGTFDLSDTNATNCTRNTTSITVSSAPSTLGFDFEVTYNSAVVRATSVTLPAGALTSGCQFAYNTNNPGLVIISIGCGTAVSGSGTIANITFDPVAPGTSNMTFQTCQRDETTCAGATGGSFVVSGCPTIALNPTSIGALSANMTAQGRGCVGARLTNSTAQVASTTTDITYDSRFATPVCALPTAVSSLGKTLSTQITAGSPNSVLRVTVSGGTSILPTGPLFICTFRTPDVAVLPRATYAFTNASTGAAANGDPIGAVGGNSQIVVTNCNGNCDGLAGVTIGEVQRALNHFNGSQLCNPDNPPLSCPSADLNNGGTVSLGEVQSSLSRFNTGCPAP